jgi:hypothetical protein
MRSPRRRVSAEAPDLSIVSNLVQLNDKYVFAKTPRESRLRP